ncbi:MAG: ATP-binding cassette domain-containing protein [Bdellovibrionales bacterium]|nr:ATP-binding cassette domain-containing protein [Bdellovibrionales bacterium]
MKPDDRVLLGAYGLIHRFGPATALSEVSVELRRGELTALIGPNGSGKSTLLKVTAGILPIQGGVVKLQGKELRSMSSAARASCVTYVGGGIRPEFPLRAREAVGLGSVSRGPSEPAKVQWAMDACGCWGLRERDVASLSGGEQQLVMLARALVQGGRVLLLDESLSKMDLHHQTRSGELLRRLCRDDGYAVGLVAHDLNLAAEWADTALLLNGGRVAGFGPVREVLTSQSLGALYPGASLTVAPSPASGAPKVFFARSR